MEEYRRSFTEYSLTDGENEDEGERLTWMILVVVIMEVVSGQGGQGGHTPFPKVNRKYYIYFIVMTLDSYFCNAISINPSGIFLWFQYFVNILRIILNQQKESKW